jgi:predicted metal-dependent enzyme (double-stranded beta helix superfamily)
MPTTTYSLARFVEDLRGITARTRGHGQIIDQVAPLAVRLARSQEWLRPAHYGCDAAQGFGLHLLHEEPDHTLAVFAAAWLPGRGAPPHNHGTWAVVAGVEGAETNVYWKRVDDRSRPGYAELERAGEEVIAPGQVVAMLPDAIHSVRNETGRVTVSLHVYGMHLNHTGRSQFDPEAKTETPFIVAVQ